MSQSRVCWSGVRGVYHTYYTGGVAHYMLSESHIYSHAGAVAASIWHVTWQLAIVHGIRDSSMAMHSIQHVANYSKVTICQYSIGVWDGYTRLHCPLHHDTWWYIAISSCFSVFRWWCFGTAAVISEVDDVTVITDPPNGPFLINNMIDFTCHVDPAPPEPVTYSWHAVKDANGPTTLSGQNTTRYTPSSRDLHFSWFFCKVFSSGTLLGVGRRMIEIHGNLFYS